MFDLSNHPRGARAFTLIELLIVMIIITVLVGVVAPKLHGFTVGRRTNDAARQIVAMARYARSESISEGRTYRLNVDASARAFWLTVQNGGQWAAPTSDQGEKFTLPDGVTLDTDIPQQQDGQYVTFTPSGRAQSAKIRLSDSIGKTVEVSCLSATELFHIVQPGEEAQ